MTTTAIRQVRNTLIDAVGTAAARTRESHLVADVHLDGDPIVGQGGKDLLFVNDMLRRRSD